MYLLFTGTEIRLNSSNPWYFIIPAAPDMAMPTALSYIYKIWNVFSIVKSVFDFLPIGLLFSQFRMADNFPGIAPRSLINWPQEENRTKVEPLMFPLEQQGLSESEEEYTKEVESLMIFLEQNRMNGSQEEYNTTGEPLEQLINGSQEKYNTTEEPLEQVINGSQEEHNTGVVSQVIGVSGKIIGVPNKRLYLTLRPRNAWSI